MWTRDTVILPLTAQIWPRTETGGAPSWDAALTHDSETVEVQCKLHSRGSAVRLGLIGESEAFSAVAVVPVLDSGVHTFDTGDRLKILTPALWANKVFQVERVDPVEMGGASHHVRLIGRMVNTT